MQSLPAHRSPEIFSEVTVAKDGQPIRELDEGHIEATLLRQTQYPPKATSFVIDTGCLLGHHEHRIISVFLGFLKESIPLPFKVAVMCRVAEMWVQGAASPSRSFSSWLRRR